MSVCLEPSTVLSASVSTATDSELLETSPATSTATLHDKETLETLPASAQSVTKLVLANSLASSAPNTAVLQKVATSSVITVVNATGPLTILKTLCSNAYVTTAPHFTLVNSSPLSVCNAVGKPITVVGAPPITVVRAISGVIPSVVASIEEKTKNTETTASTLTTTSSVNGSLTSASERPPIHNVYVKNTTAPPDLIPSTNEVPQKTTTSFLPTNVVQTITTVNAAKTSNSQKPTTGSTSNSKLKIISNVVVPPATTTLPLPTAGLSTPNNSNIILNKSAPSKQYLQQKMINSSLNGTSKFVNRTPAVSNNFVKTSAGSKPVTSSKTQKVLYPTHKSQIRTLPPVSNSVSKSGIKTLSPQSKGISSQQVQRTSSGLRTIPPQRPQKLPNKPNYIGKHAIQAQKYKSTHGIGKTKNVKPPIPTMNNVFSHRTPQNTGVTYHQALTANIIQSLSESSSGTYSSNKNYFGSCDASHNYNENKSSSYGEIYVSPPAKPQSNLEALSFVCQAVLLDHNYNATPPTDPPPTRTTPTTSTSVQLNGASVGSYYSPTSSTRNRASVGGSTNTLSTLSSSSSSSLLPSNSASGLLQDDDAASDISCGSERKVETEGEETDTAPEAEAVNNEDSYDHYGDYVTRCLCGFLHDDGFMIECDKCKVWQHVRCVIKQNKKVPDDYLCEVCDPTKPVDRAKARSLQQQWMRENQEREAKLRKEARMRELKLQKDSLSDSDSSDGEPIAGASLNSKNRVTVTNRRKSEGQRQSSKQRRDSTRSDNIIRRNAKRKERKTNKKKPKPSPKTHSDEETQETWPPHSSISQLPQLRQWIENYEEAVTNHYSPELRARMSSIRINGVHSDLSTQIDNSVHKCRVYTQPLTSLKYLVSTMHLPLNTPIIELRGKYMLSTQHRGNALGSGALTTRHAQRPGPFLFFYQLHKDYTEVCVDTRTYGNDARFVRRSCKPNSELRHCIEKGVLHLYIVTIMSVEKNLELTIKHESHDLAAVGTTHIACACGKPEECSVNKTPTKKNGESADINSTSVGLRKKRGRRTVSSTSEQEPATVTKIKEEIPLVSPVDLKPEPEIKVEPEIKQEDIKPPKEEEEEAPIVKEECPNSEGETAKEEEPVGSPSPPPAMNTRKSTQKSDTDEKKESPKDTSSADKKKLSREERKIEAYMKAFERMERQQQRKQEHQAKQAHRRESEPSPLSKDDDREPKAKRRRRKGRSRTTSTNSQARRNRLNSADSSYATSGDECLLSPNDGGQNQNLNKDFHCDNPNKEAGLLLALAHCENSNRSDLKSPIPDVDCNSNSANSSPETPLSSACLLVAAAVEPLEPSFKFPKTKKGLMNEWLNKSPECVQSASSISPSSLTPHITPSPENSFYETPTNNNFFTPSKNLVALAQAANYCDLPSQPHGNAKKRWLRQAISEDQCDSPTGRPDSPPLSEMVAPPKKRRLPRESLSSDVSPPTTPTNSNPPVNVVSGEDMKRFQEQEGSVEIVTAGTDGDSPIQVIMDDATLKERVAEMQQEIGSCFRLPEPRDLPQKEPAPSPLRCVLDPRLSRPMFNNSEHLVATVEKNLSILGFEEQKSETAVPTKRKLSINEYRQRKQLTVNEKMTEEPPGEENTLSQSPPQKLRPRSDSASSATSFMSSDDEMHPSELPAKVMSAFNSEPTELEKQRETVGLRLKKAFGLSIEEDSNKTALKMETLLNCELPSPAIKSTSQRYSPTFPIPGSSATTPPVVVQPPEPSPPEETVTNVEELKEEETDKNEESMEVSVTEEEQKAASSPVQEDSEKPQTDASVKPEMFYTPDEDDAAKPHEVEMEEVQKCEAYDVVESTNYVPPFNNPVYPNSNFTSFGSVMDDDAPYEGRNPSPPPELSSASNSYSSP